MTKRLLFLACFCLPIALAAQGPEAPTPDPWSLHGQLTYQLQGHGGFTSPYAGDNSLQDRREVRGSFTTTFFAGRRLWEGAELYANAEAFAGAGVSRVLGLAAPPNGATYRVDSTTLKVGLARLFLRQTWNLESATEAVADGPNQVATH